MNLHLLTHYVEWVETQAELPESEREWDQRAWGRVTECGTTYCIARKVANDEGYHPTVDPINHMLDFGRVAKVRDANNVDEDVERVDRVAARVLGINLHQAYHLFSQYNTARDVRRIAEKIAGQPLVREKATA